MARMLLLAAVLCASAGALRAPQPRGVRSSLLATTEAPTPDPPDDAISKFCIGTNDFFKALVVPPLREYAAVRPGGTAGDDFFSVVTAAPETPGIPRPVWLTIAASAPTGLLWYGWYKYSVEEELFQHELATEGRVRGCGGYGTLLPFVFGVLLGGPLALAGSPVGVDLLDAAGAWILLGQLNLYRRVNEFYPGDAPLHAWWALLPPPLDVVVGLRQVHFLSEFWRRERGLPPGDDRVARDWFPFISAPRFTLREFVSKPSLWFAVTKDWPDWDLPLLRNLD